MKKPMINRVHLEGYLYEHDLQLRESGPNSKNPGTQFIMGNVHVATDDNLENVVAVHFTYVTATTAKGNANATFEVLKNIIDGKFQSVTGTGIENAVKLRIDTAVGVNDFYVNRNGQDELVSAKRNEGGFVHVTPTIDEDEKQRNTFENDIVITKVIRQEANEETKREERVIISGFIFDFRNGVLPVEYVATNSSAMNYFESLGASANNPIFTKVRGRQISTTVVRTITEEGAFGEPSVREIKSSRKEFLVTWAQGEPYVWDDESSITAAEMREALSAREIYLADVKKRQDEYNASRTQAAAPKATAVGGFQF